MMALLSCFRKMMNDDVRLKSVNLVKGISLTQMSHLNQYGLGVADVMDYYHDLRLTKEEVVGVLDIAPGDDFAIVTWVARVEDILPRMDHRDGVRLVGVARVKGIPPRMDHRDGVRLVGVARVTGIPPRMDHRDGVHLVEVALAKGNAQFRVGQVDEGVLYIGQRVGFANVTILRNMMNCPLVDFRLARDSIQTRMRQVDALRRVGLANVTVLMHMMIHHLDGFRLAREGI